jgi:hypothetical protein
MFKKKSKKGSAAPLVAAPSLIDPLDATLEDVLFAQLDAKEQQLSSKATSQDSQSPPSLDSSQSTKLQKPKKDSKLRFKAREVGLSAGGIPHSHTRMCRLGKH